MKGNKIDLLPMNLELVIDRSINVTFYNQM